MSSAIKNFVSRHGAWLLVGLAILFVFVVRVRLREMPLERDEGEYAYAGQLILRGVPPYKEVYNMKLPGTYAAYAAIMAVFGQSPAGIHLGVMLVNLGSIVLVFLLGRKLLDQTTGVVAAMVFALMSLSPYVFGLAGHATHFVTFFALAGILVLLRACEPASDNGPRTTDHGPRAPDGAPRTTQHATRNTHPTAGSQPFTINYPLFLAGLLFGLAFLMKQHGVFFGAFGLLYLLWTRFQARREEVAAANHPARRRSTFRPDADARSAPTKTSLHHSNTPLTSARNAQLSPVVSQFTTFSAGFALPYAATCLILWAAGVFPQFWFWTVSYAGKYVASISAFYSADMLRNGLRAVVGPNLGLWLLPWAGALVMWWDDRLKGGSSRPETRNPKHPASRITDHASRVTPPASRIPHPRFFLTAFLFCSFASISVGFYFREHYFITLLPALALLCGVAVSRALHLLRHDKTIELFLALPILLLLVVGVGAALLGNSAFWFVHSPGEAVNYCYGTSLFSEAAQAGDYLRTNAPPSARVAVLGSEPEILFYCGRRSATGYIYTYPLMEEHSFASTMQQQMIDEIERSKPEYAVYIDDNYSWLPQAHSDRRILDWWSAYWPTNMDVVLTRPIQGKAELTAQAFPMPNAPDRPPEQRYLLLLKRKPQMHTDGHR